MIQLSIRLAAVLLCLAYTAVAGNETAPGDEFAKVCMKKLGNNEEEQALLLADQAQLAGYKGPEPDYARAMVNLRRGLYDSSEIYGKRAIETDFTYMPGYEVVASAQAYLFKWDTLEVTCRTGLGVSPSNQVMQFFLEKALSGQRTRFQSHLVTAGLIIMFIVGFWNSAKDNSSALRWSTTQVVAVGGTACLLMYYLFFLMAPAIWPHNLHLPLSEMLEPAERSALERDGFEGYVLYAVMIAVVAMTFPLFGLVRHMRNGHTAMLLVGVMALCSIWYVLNIGFYPPEAAVARNSSTVIGVMAVITLLAAILVWALEKFPRITSVALMLILIPVCFIAIKSISMFDYSFILAPAVRLLQGVKLSEIYLQYDLLLSLVAAIWFKLGGSLSSVQLIGQASMYVFYLAAFVFAKRFFREKRLVGLFIISLLIVRTYGNYHDPSVLMQVTSLRLDWWLLLLVVAYGKGARHWSMGVALGSLVLVHRNFGLLYLVAYCCLSVGLLINALHRSKPSEGWTFKVVRREVWSWFLDYRLNGVVVAAFVALAFLLFDGFGAESALMYQKLGLGMMKINKQSLYWFLPMIFSAVVLLLWQQRYRLPERYSETTLFAVFLAISNSMYYFGRSHDNNIVNISGVLLLVVFCFFDLHQSNAPPDAVTSQLSMVGTRTFALLARRNTALAMSFLLLLGVSYVYSEKIAGRVSMQAHAFKSGRWLLPPNINKVDIASVSAIISDRNKVYVLDQQQDFLYHYLGGYPLIGYFNPYAAWVIKSNFLRFANDLLSKGYSIVIPMHTEVMEVIPELNYNVVRASNEIYALSYVKMPRTLPARTKEMFHVSFPDTAATRSVYRWLNLTSGMFTFEVLIDPASAKDVKTLVFGAVDDDNRGVLIETAGTSDASCNFAIGDGASFRTIVEILLKPGQLNRLTLSGNTETLFLYHNGMLIHSTPQPKMLRQDQTSLVIGSQFGPSNATRGLIREFSASAECIADR